LSRQQCAPAPPSQLIRWVRQAGGQVDPVGTLMGDPPRQWRAERGRAIRFSGGFDGEKWM